MQQQKNGVLQRTNSSETCRSGKPLEDSEYFGCIHFLIDRKIKTRNEMGDIANKEREAHDTSREKECKKEMISAIGIFHEHGS